MYYKQKTTIVYYISALSPIQWKLGIVIIPKEGKSPTEISSFRPITQLLILYKTFEKLVIEQMKQLVTER